VDAPDGNTLAAELLANAFKLGNKHKATRIVITTPSDKIFFISSKLKVSEHNRA